MAEGGVTWRYAQRDGREKQLAPRRVPFRREERLRCRKVWAALKEDAALSGTALGDATRLPRLRLGVRQFSGSSLRVVS